MADFEKVYAIKVDASKALQNIAALEKSAKGLDKTMARMNKRSIGSDFQKNLDKSGKKTVELKKKLFGVRRGYKVAGAAALGFSVLAIKSNIKLNESMANVQTLLSGGTEQTLKLKGAIQQLSMETGKPTEDLADGLYEVVSALGESTDNMNQLSVASKAAIAGRSSTIGAVKLLAAVTKGYGDTSSEAQSKVSDLAFQTVKLGQTTFPELAASMGTVVPLAAAMNTSQEELFGTMATMTGVTGNTSEVTTQLASIYSAFMKPTAKLTALAKKLGYESSVQMIKEQGLAGAVKSVTRETEGNEAELAKMLRRKEALVGVLGLATNNFEAYDEKLKGVARSTGATEAAYRAQTTGINAQGFAFKQTAAQINVLSQNIGQNLLPVMKNLLSIINPIVAGLAKIETDPHMEKSEEAFMARANVAKVGTASQKQAALNKMLAEQKTLAKTSISGEDVSFKESVAYMFTGGESPMEKRKRRLDETNRAIAALQGGLNKDYMSTYNPATSLGMKAPGTGNTNNNVMINVTGTTSPEAVAVAVEKRLKNALKRGGNMAGAGEQ